MGYLYITKHDPLFLLQIDRWDTANDKVIYILTVNNMIYREDGEWFYYPEKDLEEYNFSADREDIFDTKEEAQRKLISKVLGD